MLYRRQMTINRTKRNWNEPKFLSACPPIKLLIEPKGIEIQRTSSSRNIQRAINRTKRNWNSILYIDKQAQLTLLIEPKGIEIIQGQKDMGKRIPY